MKSPKLRFHPFSWLKLNWFCHREQVEIGGFGITKADDLLYVEHFETVLQKVNLAKTDFDPDGIADYIEGCVDDGLELSQCARIWLHTHPGDGVNPSGTDEDTFAESFGACDFAVMFILGRGGQTYARLRIRQPELSMEIPVEVDWSKMGDIEDLPTDDWAAEYVENIEREKWVQNPQTNTYYQGAIWQPGMVWVQGQGYVKPREDQGPPQVSHNSLYEGYGPSTVNLQESKTEPVISAAVDVEDDTALESDCRFQQSEDDECLSWTDEDLEAAVEWEKGHDTNDLLKLEFYSQDSDDDMKEYQNALAAYQRKWGDR